MKSKQTLLKACTSLFVLSLLLFSSCQEEKKDCPCEEPKEPETIEQPKGIITKDEAAVLFKEYTESRIPDEVAKLTEDEKENYVPARYTEFDFEVIKEYVKYIEQEAKAVDTEIETLRIYYAVYPEGKGDRSNKTTVFLVPAADFDGKNRAFQIGMVGERSAADTIPWDFGTGIKQIGMLSSQHERQYATFGPMPASSSTMQVNKSLVLNDGSTAPPPYH